MATLRHPTKFESADASVSYEFSLHGMEWQSEQSFRTALATIAGADYAHDYNGFGPSPRDPARERLRCILVESSTGNLEAEIDEARGECTNIGKGKLFIEDSDSSLRWAWARLASMPALTVSAQGVDGANLRHTFVVFDFIRLSNWHDATAYDEEFPVDASPETFDVVNPGNAPVYDAVIRIRANDTDAVTFPLVFTNTTNGMAFTLDRDDFTTANEEERITCASDLVEYSDDDGAEYAADPSALTLPAGQTRIMRFEPGTNAISVATAGTPDYDIDIDYVPQYV